MSISRPTAPRPPRGFALTEAVAGLAAVTLAVAIAIPAFARVRGDGRIADSLDNLRTLGAAHASYAADWNGRQFTAVNDVMTAYGSNAAIAFNAFNDGSNPAGPHPPVTLGWGELGEGGNIAFFAYRTTFNLANARLCEPIVFSGPNFNVNGYFGSFRFTNDARFTPYVGGRFYDPVFYAASDTIVWPLVEPYADEPWEFVYQPDGGSGDIPYWGSYCLSPAAMLDPAVMAGRRFEDGQVVGGWQDPWSSPTGLRSPAMDQARYPHLKTHLLEHHWLQNAPLDPCNPFFSGGTFGGCEPYYFNHGYDSDPATLFYDGSTRLFSNLEAVAADEVIRRSSGGDGFDGTWTRSTPFGDDGYFNDGSFDAIDVSHHVLTADGILGRDTIDPDALDAPSGTIDRDRRRAGSTTSDAVRTRRPPAFSTGRWSPGQLDHGPHKR